MNNTLTLSEKILKINNLPDLGASYDIYEVVQKEIEALECFSENELVEIYGTSSITWILKMNDIRGLKDKANRILVKPEVSLGDIISFKNVNGTFTAIVLRVYGRLNDRLDVMYNDDDHFVVKEGVSVYDVKFEGKNHQVVDILSDL